jgi:transcriptional regulator with XRE-family HTH domain
VAAAAGITKSAVSYLESGKFYPSIHTLGKLEELFEKPWRELFSEAIGNSA